MDTKSKNIKYSFAVRAAAFILALIFVGAAGCFASSFARSFFTYNAYEDRSFHQTDIFRRLMNYCENEIIFSAEIRGCRDIEDFKKTETAKNIIDDYQTTKAKITEAFDLLDKSGIEYFRTEDNIFRYRLNNGGTVYYFRYDGELISSETFFSYNDDGDEDSGNTVEESTTAVAGVPAGALSDVQKIKSALSFLYNYGPDTNYGETSKELLLARADLECKSRLETEFKDSKFAMSGICNSMKAFDYAVFLTNGNVVTNCGITRADGYEKALSKLSANSYLTEAYDGKSFRTVTAPGTKAYKPSASALARIGRSSIAEASALETSERFLKEYGIETAVFSYKDPAPGDDLVSVYSDVNNSFRASAGGRASLNKCNILFSVFFLAAIALFVFLAATAGKTDTGEIKLMFTDKVPLGINIIFYGFIIISAGVICVGLHVCEADPYENYSIDMEILRLIGTHITQISAVLFAVCFGTLAFFINSIVRNIRANTFFRHTLCRIILTPFRFLAEKLKYIVNSAGNGSKKTHRIIAYCVITVAAVIAFILTTICHEDDLLFAFALIIDAVLLTAVLFAAANFFRISTGTGKIRSGEIGEKIGTEKMLPFMKNHAEDINSIGDGLQEAVDSAVKDQRMKAELITNVSHDLKTPLTSIVTYVDLLKRCEVENEDARKYIGILDEKSLRMKKLIEDLVEASKASSGAVEINPVKLDLCEFAAQAVGENEDELKEKGISIVLKLPDHPVTVNADPQKTGRIIENLFSNIRKYSLENTRAYVEVSDSGGKGMIVFKNISKYELNVPADELTARFVRGDASRNGEGSGLGLSIAENLCILQGGNFGVSVDGDLFKAVVSLPKA